MPNLSAAKKSLRQDKKRTAHNRSYKNRIKTLAREISDLANAGNAAEASAKLPAFFKAIDKAAKRNILHKNTAARRKAVMSRRIQASTADAKSSQAK